MEGAIGQAAGAGVVPAVDAGKGIFNCLRSKYKYVKNISKNFTELKNKEKQLCDREKDIRKVLDNNARTMEMTQGCDTWQKEVEEEKSELEKLKKRYADIKKCLCGMCPFPCLLKLGKDIEKEIKKVDDLVNRMPLENPIMIQRAPQPPAQPVPFIKKHAKKIDDVPSLNEHVETLLEWLNDKNLKRICIWGLPGVGKTTVMENLNNKVSEIQLFDLIIWVKVSKEETATKIQDAVAEWLHLEVEGIRNREQIAAMISTALENKRYLLLLDEVFSEINLNEVGIHDDHEYGKVVFASRYRYVCDSADEEIYIKRLSNADALKMFRDIVGNVMDHPHIKPTAEKVVKECGGLPQVIKLIARRLKNKADLALWKDTKIKLQSPSQNQEQDLEKVCKAFELVYDQVSEEKRLCLLYWAFFPDEYEIYGDYLIECWRAEQFVTHTLKLGEARDKGHGILEEFVDKSLLERGGKVGHFKMPVFFQRKALDMTKANERSFRFLVGDSEGTEEPSAGEKWENAKTVSLICRQLNVLPERPKCCSISRLLLQNNASLTSIPELFFGYMCGLRVLDLYDTKITTLPSSICSLMNLRGLYLNNCTLLVKLPTEIEGLESLEILDIRRTGLQALPREIGQLTGLKCLRVSFKENVGNQNNVEANSEAMIPCNIIASLSLLEELSIDVNPDSLSWSQIVDAIAKEVASLRELTSLCFYFPNVSCFITFIEESKSWKRRNNMRWGGSSFRSFRILVGYDEHHIHGSNVFGYSTERHLRFSAGRDIPITISEVLNHTRTFELIGHHTAKNLSDFGSDRLQGLEACSIKECNEMESIVDVDGNMTTDVAFQFLQKLHLINLPKLVHIWNGSMGSQSFTSLTILTIKGCPKVRMLFSERMVLRLSHLQYLQVEDCKEIIEIIEAGSIIDNEAFPKLKNLELCELPRLSSISCGFSLIWPSLETIVIKTCAELRNLPSSMENPARLRTIKCTRDWWIQLVWPNDVVKDRFKNFPNFI